MDGDVVDGFGSWGELADHLRGPWEELADGDRGLLLLSGGQALVVVEPPAARARHRRALHQAGFRRTPTSTTTWLWSAAAPPPAGTPDSAPASRAGQLADPDWLRRHLETQRRLADTAVHVVRDVFGCSLDGLVLTLPSDDEEDRWDDDDDELLS